MSASIATPGLRIKLGLLLLVSMTIALLQTVQAKATEASPNVLWLTCEDISPNLGCYGDDYAITPNFDRLAER